MYGEGPRQCMGRRRGGGIGGVGNRGGKSWDTRGEWGGEEVCGQG